MTEQLVDKPFKELVDSVSTKSAAPGGGSIAAAAGAFGAGLVAMVCRFTIGKDKYQVHWSEFEEILTKVETLQTELVGLIDKDSEAYNEIVKTFRSKSEFDDENAFQAKVQAAYKYAAEVPLSTAQRSFEVLKLAKIAVEKGNENTITDAGVGAQMAYAGVVGGMLNVKINLGSIENEEFKLKTASTISEHILIAYFILSSQLPIYLHFLIDFELHGLYQ
jgi:formiminotetrahydrofolate cyclodeaminase